MSALFLRRLGLGFIVGITVAAYGQPSFFVMTGAALAAILVVVLASRRWQFYGWIMVAIIVGGFWLQAQEARWQFSVQRAQAAVVRQELFQVRLKRVNDQGMMNVSIIEPTVLSGRRLNIRLTESTVAPGTALSLRCQTIIPASNGSFAKGRNEIGLCLKPEILAQTGRSKLADWRQRVQTLASERINRLFDQPSSGFFQALLLGDTSSLQPLVVEAFRQTGTSHVIAISGLHFALLGIMLNVVLEAMLLKPKMRFSMLIILVTMYVWLVGPAPSVVRGAIFALAMAGAYVVGRAWPAWHMLVLTALVFLLIDPLAIFDISFLLSFSATAGMILITPWLELCLRRRPFLARSARVSALMLGPILATGPVLLLFTNVPLISPLANLLVVPLASALMGLGLLAVIGSFPLFSLAAVLAKILEQVLAGILLMLQPAMHLLPVIPRSGNYYFIQSVWLVAVGVCFYLGTRALAPKPLLFYTVSNGEITPPSVDRG